MALWYYTSDGLEHGPITAEELRVYLAEKATPLDKFTSEVMDEWVFASEALAILDGGSPPGALPFVNAAGEIQCRKCGSSHVHSAKRGYRFGRGGIFGMHQVLITCLKCGAEFLPGGERY